MQLSRQQVRGSHPQDWDRVMADSDNRKKQNTETSGGGAASSGRRRRDPSRYMIPQLLALVLVFIVLFEGNVIRILITHRPGSSVTAVQGSSAAGSSSSADSSAAGTDSGLASSDASVSSDSTSSVQLSDDDASPAAGLAGLAAYSASAQDAGSSGEETQSESSQDTTSGEVIESAALVPEQSTSVDDSYFSDAVFIGDSRMEGFRNASGITQGTFLTGVGLSINDMDKAIISSADGTISVYQGLSGRQYDRIYLMLGTNDLGYYQWDSFLDTFEGVLEQFHRLQPDAIIYVCSVIYVEESKISAGFEYDNNDNVQKINGYLLTACEDLWYSYYLNLNEVLSDGKDRKSVV